VVEDARKGEAYVQVFNQTTNAPQIVALDGLADIIGALPLAGGSAPEAADLTGNSILAQPVSLAEAIARIAASHDRARAPRPAPFYLRSAHATPSSDPPLVILP
jgi:tRNA threonylcarbamoyladenosine biosynthesis protein TsaB